MKVDKLKIGAVIPTQQYGNLAPEIEITVENDIETAKAMGLGFMRDLFARYSEKGALVEKKLPTVIRKSFNEDVEIEFEPVNHTYSHNGRVFTSATDYIKRFYKPFDADTISSVLESKWGVPQAAIRGMWEANGGLTSVFGNVVHQALEYYEKYRSYGEIISSQQNSEDNYCLPKHPILKEIIKGFLEITKDETGKVMTEVLLSDVASGICGTADRLVILDEEKKICRIKDYKVNIDSEVSDKKYKVLPPFQDLPQTKISKYQLQMSIYANMLQKSGWTVEGLNVYVYEDKWQHFELPVLQVIK